MNENVLRLAEKIQGLLPEEALPIIQDRLISPCFYDLAYLCGIIKEGRPDVPYDRVFDVLGYSPGTLKSMVSCMNDFHKVMKGDLGRRVSLGYFPLDKCLRGVRPGQVCGVMARASVGKTAFACNVVVNIFKRNNPHPVLFLSLEMPAPEIAARIFCIDNREQPSRVEDYFSEAQGDPRVARWARKFQDLVIVDEGSLDIAGVEKCFRDAEGYLGQRIPLVVIDYLGCIKARGASAYERTSNAARDLKALAKKLNTAVLVLIQTSRQGGTGGDPVSLAMARDSGVVEEACDFLLAAWRPELSGDGEQEGLLVVSILKNRHGKTGEFFMYFDRSCLRITERDYDRGMD